MLFEAQSNVVAYNACGYYFDSFVDTTAGQIGCIINDTIANNTYEGLLFDGTFTASGAPAPLIANCIVWNNNATGSYVQHGGTAGYAPCSDSDMINTDWMNLSGLGSCDGSNIDEDPEFADAPDRDYHLTASSTDLIDTGTNSPGPTLSLYDIDLQDRTVDGGSSSPIVDMGADEYDP
jgi:hypothetical protein